MTNKTTMKEPICYANVVDIESYKESPRVNRRIPGAYDVPLYTKDQAEAYADARVREALEMAAQEVELTYSYSEYEDRFRYRAAQAIRALTPTTK